MIAGPLNLDDAHVGVVELTFINSLLASDLILTTAHLDGYLQLVGTVVAGKLDEGSAQFDGGIIIVDQSRIADRFTLDVATVRGSVSLLDSSIGGSFSLEGSQTGGYLGVVGSEIDGEATFAAAAAKGGVTIQGSKFKSPKPVSAFSMQAGPFFAVVDTTFAGDLMLTNSSFAGNAVFQDLCFAPDSWMHLEGLRIDGFLGLQNITGLKGIGLGSARIEAYLDMSGLTFARDGSFIAPGLHVGGTFIAAPTNFGNAVTLVNADIGLDLNLSGLTIGPGGEFNAPRLRTGGNLVLNDGHFASPVALDGSDVRGQLSIVNGSFSRGAALSMERVHVGRDVFFRNNISAEPVDMVGLTADGVDLRGSTLGGLDLSNAVINGDLRLGGRFSNGEESWTKWAGGGGATASVVLRNTRAGALQDDDRSWDNAQLLLQGFTYQHLGGVGGVSQQDMRNRGIKTWRKWLARDPIYSPQPYAQLASVLAAGGNGDVANAIRFLARDRERIDTMRDCRWPHLWDRTCNLTGWIGLSILQATIGYGIGEYTFRAVWWTLALTMIGTVVLLFAPGGRGPGPRKPLLWCFGAALNHVLPVVSLSAEFNDFFNDPMRERLLAWQQVVFAILALCGWLLSFFVIAAISGLTQG